MKLMIKIIFAFTLFICSVSFSGTSVHASSLGEVEATGDLESDGKYMDSTYHNNYFLDMEKCALLDIFPVLMNTFANGLLFLIKYVVLATVTLFNKALTIDLPSLFSGKIKDIMNLLNIGIFKPLLFLGLAGSFITVVKRIIQQNVVGIMTEIGKSLILVILSVCLVAKSQDALSFATTLTKNISLSAMNGLNITKPEDAKQLNTYVSEATGMLWENMFHKPWLSLEFGDGVTANEELVGRLMITKPSTEARASLVAENASYFPKELSLFRFGQSIFLLFIVLIKGALLLFVSFFLILYQLIAMLYLFLAPLVLILAFFPGYNTIINVWFKKFLETQICIFIITLMLGLIIKIDSILFSMGAELGWLGAMIFQVGVMIIMVTQREKILSSFTVIQRAVENPGYASSMLRNANSDAARQSAYAAGKTAIASAHAVKSSAIASAHAVKSSAIATFHGAQTVGRGIHYLASSKNRAAATYFSGQTMNRSTNQSGNSDADNVTSFDQYKQEHTVDGQYVSRRPNLYQSVQLRKVVSNAPSESQFLLKKSVDGTGAAVVPNTVAMSGTRMREASDATVRYAQTAVPPITEPLVDMSESASIPTAKQDIRPVWSESTKNTTDVKAVPVQAELTASPNVSVSGPITTTHADYAQATPSAHVPATGNATAKPTNPQQAPEPPISATGRRTKASTRSFTGIEVNTPVAKKTRMQERPVMRSNATSAPD